MPCTGGAFSAAVWALRGLLPLRHAALAPLCTLVGGEGMEPIIDLFHRSIGIDEFVASASKGQVLMSDISANDRSARTKLEEDSR
eukprot:COSAG06_NODE_1070_length_10820_cov_4.675494_2_plen_85_part_00